MRTRLTRLFLFLSISLISISALGADLEDGTPVTDPSLLRRLSVATAYTTKPGDTLEAVANLLYGHRSWWLKLRERNKSLIGYSANDRLPAGTRLAYLAPKVGTDYVVHRNDWLIRIVQWKYGDTSQWEEIYRKNASQITNPNLIYPGERLSLERDGTIRKSSGEVIVRGLNTPTPGAAPIAAPTPVREIASQPKEPELLLGMNRQYLLTGFASGVALLLFMPLFWWVTRPREQTVGAPEPHLYLGTEEEEPEPEPEPVPVPARKGFPYTFKRRPNWDLAVDKSMIQEEDGEVNRGPNYFTISGTSSGKRRKFMRKRNKG